MLPLFSLVVIWLASAMHAQASEFKGVQTSITFAKTPVLKVDYIKEPVWSADGKHLKFVQRAHKSVSYLTKPVISLRFGGHDPKVDETEFHIGHDGGHLLGGEIQEQGHHEVVYAHEGINDAHAHQIEGVEGGIRRRSGKRSGARMRS